jgi:hypothetical protein
MKTRPLFLKVYKLNGVTFVKLVDVFIYFN